MSRLYCESATASDCPENVTALCAIHTAQVYASSVPAPPTTTGDPLVTPVWMTLHAEVPDPLTANPVPDGSPGMSVAVPAANVDAAPYLLFIRDSDGPLLPDCSPNVLAPAASLSDQ